MITTIIFDLGEVFLQGIKEFEISLEPMLGIDSERIAPMLIGNEFELIMTGKISEEEYWNRLINKHNWNCCIWYSRCMGKNLFK